MWWQEYNPQAQIFSLGSIHINWYGLILVLAIVAAAYLARQKLAKDSVMTDRQFEDLFFYLVIFGLIGARVAHVVFEWQYYSLHPQEIVQIWRGGISLYGSLLGGILAAWWWSRKNSIKLLKISDRILPFFALAQSVGRWGNYFNQELFGRPTDSILGIYIDPVHRPLLFYNYSHFQPAFFYESVLDFILFFVLWRLSKKRLLDGKITYFYIIGYTAIRFFMEFVRVDNTAMLGFLRLPQILSMALFFGALYFLVRRPISTLPKSQK